MDGFIVVSDESVNQYGFRILSSGGDFSRFSKNPIMLYVHERNANGKAKLPIGKWEALQVTSDNKIIAKPVFNEKNAQGLECKESFEGGFLNAASIHVDPIEWSEDPALMLPGQPLPTITKWVLMEISMADIPVNGNAVRLSHHGKTITLSSDGDHSEELSKLFHPIKPDSSMKSIIAVLNTLSLGLSLSDTASEVEVLGVLQKALSLQKDTVIAKDTLINQLTTERDSYKLAKEAAEVKAIDDKATALVDGAISAKKIVAGQKDHFVKLAKADYDSTKAILDSAIGFQPIGSQLKIASGELSITEKKAKYDELFKGSNGELAALKSSDWDAYADLYKAKYGTEPKK